MQQSHNVLVIERIDVHYGFKNNHSDNVSASLFLSLRYHCSETGNLFGQTIIETRGEAFGDLEAIRNAVQSFLDKDYYSSKSEVFDVCNNSILHKGIDAIIVEIKEEPFLSFFNDLFNTENWQLAAKEIDVL